MRALAARNMNGISPQHERRGLGVQTERREMETQLRKKAVVFREALKREGVPYGVSACRLGLSVRTLAAWASLSRHSHSPRALGRPQKRAGVNLRNEILSFIQGIGPAASLESLRKWFPGVARREIECLLKRYRVIWSRRHRQLVHVLAWPVPGTVWATDHVRPPEPIGGIYREILSVRDLGSGRQLLWRAVPGSDSVSVITALRDLFYRHGPPLVIKSDNGPAFISDDTRGFLLATGVFQLCSPPLTPEYNGACEAAGGWLKRYTESIAFRAGRPGLWRLQDLEGALALSLIHRGPDPEDQEFSIPDDFRRDFTATVEEFRKEVINELKLPEFEQLRSAERRQVDRISIRRALVEHGLLIIRRRLVSPPIKSKKCA